MNESYSVIHDLAKIKKFKQDISTLQADNEQLRQALQLCNEDRTWCYSCRTPMGNIVGGIKHTDDCEYVKLCKT